MVFLLVLGTVAVATVLVLAFFSALDEEPPTPFEQPSHVTLLPRPKVIAPDVLDEDAWGEYVARGYEQYGYDDGDVA